MISRDYNALTMSVLALVSMLYPLEYMFPVIPLLPCLMPSSEQILLAPTPYVIGIPASFVLLKKITLPKDVWVIDLDSNKIFQPKNESPLPNMPEREDAQLRAHLYQALRAMGADDNTISQSPIERNLGGSEVVQESYIYGSDVDSVDVATRVALIRFFDSHGVLRGSNKHMRTLRLYPRPVVAFQADCFLQSIEKVTNQPVTEECFIAQLARTQAVEYFGEWSLSPSNVAFMRIQNGIWDPALIGDKPKWFSQHLESINYNITIPIKLDRILANSDLIESGSEVDITSLQLTTPMASDQHLRERPENLVLTRTRPPMSRGSSISVARSTSNSSIASSQKSSSSPHLPVRAASHLTKSDRQQEVRALQQARLAARQKKRLEINQDAELIREAAREALDGSGVSWIRLRKIKKLMEFESWRLYMLSRLNQLTQREENTVYVECVEISTKAFKGMSDLLKCIESGLETNFRERRGHGGLSSVFFLMEIGHTHFCTREDVSMSPRTSLTESFSSFDNTVKAARSAASGAMAHINRQLAAQRITEGSAAVTSRISDSSASSDLPSTCSSRELKYRGGKMIEVETDEDENEFRVYLYQSLSRDETSIWRIPQLWENAFLDVVSLERDALGMEHGPTDMIVRYKNLAEAEKRRLEHDEDKLLVTILYNMSAFMIMMDVIPSVIRRKVRRMLGKSHIGLQQDKEIQKLLGKLEINIYTLDTLDNLPREYI